MKGSMQVKLTNKIFRFLLALRGRQLRLEREKIRAIEETDRILSAYLAILIEKNGMVRVSRAEVREIMGKYRATVAVDGDDYVIRVISAGGKGDDSEGSSLC